MFTQKVNLYLINCTLKKNKKKTNVQKFWKDFKSTVILENVPWNFVGKKQLSVGQHDKFAKATWTWCKICVGKFFILTRNSRLHGFLLKWLDENSPSSGECDSTYCIYIYIYIYILYIYKNSPENYTVKSGTFPNQPYINIPWGFRLWDHQWTTSSPKRSCRYHEPNFSRVNSKKIAKKKKGKNSTILFTIKFPLKGNLHSMAVHRGWPGG